MGNFMLDNILAFIAFGLFVASIVGLVKPSLVKQKSRVKAFFVYLGSAFAIAVVAGSAKTKEGEALAQSSNELIVVLVLLLIILGFLLFSTKKKNKLYETKYKDLIDIEKEKETLLKEMTQLKEKYNLSEKELLQGIDKDKKELYKKRYEISKEMATLKSDYINKKAIYDKLLKDIALYHDEIKLQELGFYEPHYDFTVSETFKERIALVRDQQKHMLSSGKAIYATTEWVVEGSKKKGKVMSEKSIKLTARAFNNECDALIAKVNWNNVQKIEQRIIKSYEAILKLNASTAIDINYDYVQLKLQELRLTYEYKLKKQEEKEEQAEIRMQMREEAKLEKELEKASKEEEKYQKLLDKAKKDAEKATGSELEKLQEKLSILTQELNEAKANNQRAKSMAEQTRSGHVYVISNIGSFGENTYKIGMTRRLEPLDRVKELGDASVPFTFDVHAMIYSDDAPSLEKTLHKVFTNKRVNLVNHRKEFFKVSLEEIEKEVLKFSPNSEFIKTVEAKEYKETQIMLQNSTDQQQKSTLPSSL